MAILQKRGCLCLEMHKPIQNGQRGFEQMQTYDMRLGVRACANYQSRLKVSCNICKALSGNLYRVAVVVLVAVVVSVAVVVG